MGCKFCRVIEGSGAFLHMRDVSQGPDIEDEVQMGVIPRPLRVSCYHASVRIAVNT